MKNTNIAGYEWEDDVTQFEEDTFMANECKQTSYIISD